jgi:hypothetical protein
VAALVQAGRRDPDGSREDADDTESAEAGL